MWKARRARPCPHLFPGQLWGTWREVPPHTSENLPCLGQSSPLVGEPRLGLEVCLFFQHLICFGAFGFGAGGPGPPSPVTSILSAHRSPPHPVPSPICTQEGGGRGSTAFIPRGRTDSRRKPPRVAVPTVACGLASFQLLGHENLNKPSERHKHRSAPATCKMSVTLSRCQMSHLPLQV